MKKATKNKTSKYYVYNNVRPRKQKIHTFKSPET